VTVLEVDENRRVRFTWSGYRPERPTTVEFRFTPTPEGHTYLAVTESGFTGTADEVTGFAIDSTGGFTFLVSSVKALLEHGIELGLVGDAHPKAR
jgi:uncharacterized protein YndB with AHSA1/START domain